MGKDKTKISVIVCSFNGAKMLKDCMTSLLEQSIPRDNYEIIFVDDCSNDHTYEIGKKYADISFTMPVNRGLAAARNKGVELANSGILAFTDDDCIVDKNWLKDILDNIEDTELLGIVGNIIPSGKHETYTIEYLKENNPLLPVPKNHTTSKSILKRFFYYLTRQIEQFDTNKDNQEVYSLVGANMILIKKYVIPVGAFDEKLDRGAEEEDLCKRLKEKYPEKKFMYKAKPTIYHMFSTKLKDSLKRSKSYGKSSARMFRKHAKHGLIIYPFPIFIALLLIISLIEHKLYFIVGIMPLGLYPRGTIRFFRTLKIKHLGFPYMNLLHEFYANWGVVMGLVTNSEGEY